MARGIALAWSNLQVWNAAVAVRLLEAREWTLDVPKKVEY
jgi:hypothetical protein